MAKKQRYYSEGALRSKWGISKAMLSKFMPEPRFRTGSSGQVSRVWTEDQVDEALAQPGLVQAIERAKKRRRRNEERKSEVRNYLQEIDVEQLRQRAEEMERSFILHVGPTNSGKTYQSVQALCDAPSGQYLGPLRLLALEMYDKLNENFCRCSLLTGEEAIMVEGAEHTASTIELCDYSRHYDVVVIDEAQMITDPFRGDRWVKAIFCVDAREVHICLAPEARDLICEILDSFGAPYEIVEHKRLAPLKYAGMFRSLAFAKPGDALIVFSRRSVLSVAAELEGHGIRASVIYGALPPVSRREEVRRFSEKETDVVVATDAIGMGLSLPIKRIIFCETRKFDGTQARDLNVAEIKQIAGRAGRYGIYDMGQVLTMNDPALIKNALNTEVKQETRLTLPFPEEALDTQYSLERLLSEWNRLPEVDGFLRADMSDSIRLLKYLGPEAEKLDRHLVYGFITCPIDADNEDLVYYWYMCCRAIIEERELPEPMSGTDKLEECERRYKELDIRHQMLRRIGREEDRMDEKLELCHRINELLVRDRKSYLKTCRRCGKVLPATYQFRICDDCFKKDSRDRETLVSRNKADRVRSHAHRGHAREKTADITNSQ